MDKTLVVFLKTNTLCSDYSVQRRYFSKHGVFDSDHVDFSFSEKRDISQYDTIIIVNSNLYGPFLPLWMKRENWVRIFNDLVKNKPYASRFPRDKDILVIKHKKSSFSDNLYNIILDISKDFFPKSYLDEFHLLKEEKISEIKKSKFWEKIKRIVPEEQLNKYEEEKFLEVRKRKYLEASIFSGKILEKSLEFLPKEYLEIRDDHPYDLIFTERKEECFLCWHDLPLTYNKNHGKTLVIYTFHEYNENVEFFVKNAYFIDEDVDFLFVVNNKTFSSFLPGKIIIRENKGYDFAAWAKGLSSDNNFEKYDYFIFVNSSVMGPFIPYYKKKKWTKIFTDCFTSDIGIVGCTATRSIAQEKIHTDNFYKYFVQSYAFALCKKSLYEIIITGFFSQKFEEMNKYQLIVNCEEFLSHHLLSRGYNLAILQNSLYQRDFLLFPHSKDDSNPAHDTNTYFGRNISPYEVLFIKNNEGNKQFQNMIKRYSLLYK